MLIYCSNNRRLIWTSFPEEGQHIEIGDQTYLLTPYYVANTLILDLLYRPAKWAGCLWVEACSHHWRSSEPLVRGVLKGIHAFVCIGGRARGRD